MRYYLKLLFLPLLLALVYSLFFFLWNFFDGPTTEELMTRIGLWFDRYGLPALFLASLIEGLFLIGSYFPGIFMVFIGVIVSESVSEATLVVLVATLGLIVAHAANYAIGRHGWYRLLVRFGLKDALERAKLRLERKGPVAIMLSYWSSTLGALTDTASGILKIPFKTFVQYSVLSTISWNALVGIIVYKVGDKSIYALSVEAMSIYMYTFVIAWIVVLLVKDHSHKAL